MIERNYYAISDTHFGHDNIIKYCKRPFANANEMDEALIENWNSVVKPWDHVWHCGDVYSHKAFGNRLDDIDQLLKKLNGHKRLVLGNHDDGRDPILRANFQRIEAWRMYPEYSLLLTHFPMHESTLGVRVSGNDEDCGPEPRQLVNVHGHIHQNPSPGARWINISVEWTDYKPVNLEDLRARATDVIDGNLR